MTARLSLFGHDHAIASFMEALEGTRMHHGWLLTGPKGVGKAVFADLAARRFLAGEKGDPFDRPSNSQLVHYMDEKVHPDFVRLERLYRDKSRDLARNISIDQIRNLHVLFNNKPSFSERRAIVIDALDDLERAAANALLKMLEEPPADTLFLLVCHAPGRILPTIRSRCCALRFAPVDASAMRRALMLADPALQNDEIDMLIAMADGAPGRALALAGLDMAAINTALAAIMANGDADNSKREALARTLSTKAAQPRYEAFLAQAPRFVAEQARQRSGEALGQALHVWEQVSELASSAIGLSLDPWSVTFEIGSLLAQLASAEVSFASKA